MVSEPERPSDAEIEIRKKRMMLFANLISLSQHRLAYAIKLCNLTIDECVTRFGHKKYYDFDQHRKWLAEIETLDTTTERLYEIIKEAEVSGIDFCPDTFLSCALRHLAKERLKLAYTEDVDLSQNICPAWFRSAMYCWSAIRTDLDSAYTQAKEWGFLTEEQLTQIRSIHE